MIELYGVSKSYKAKGVTKHVLNGFTYTFSRGRNFAIVGPNGVGKSTLMHLISGAETPDAGRIVRHVRVSWPLGPLLYRLSRSP